MRGRKAERIETTSSEPKDHTRAQACGAVCGHEMLCAGVRGGRVRVVGAYAMGSEPSVSGTRVSPFGSCCTLGLRAETRPVPVASWFHAR